MKAVYNAFEKYKQETNIGPARYTVPTNGKLLTGERAEWILKNNIAVMLSYDGTGQAIRGEDVLQNKQVVETVKKLYEKQLLCVNMVITKDNMDVTASIKMLKDIIGGDNFSIGESKILRVTTDCAYKHRVPEDKLFDFTNTMYEGIISGEIRQWLVPEIQALRFLGWLNKPLSEHPNCVSIRPLSVIVDIAGNVLTCHNETADHIYPDGEKNYRGHITTHTYKSIKLPEVKRWKKKLLTRCMDCLVRAVCHADCPMLPEKYDDYNCKSAYAFSLPMVALALYKLTGGLLTHIEKE